MKKVIPADSVLIPDQAKCVFKGAIFDVYQWSQPMFDGTNQTFEMLKRADTVSVICIVDNKILVIDDEQPHSGVRKSFPGGRVDETDESIEAAAQREVLEETGYSFRSWRLIKVMQPYRKIEWFVYLLLAWDLESRVPPAPDAGEDITVAELDFDDCKGLIENRVGYLGESHELFENISSTEQLLALPEFTGQSIDR